MKNRLLLLTFFLFSSGACVVNAQTYNMSSAAVTTCSGSFFDSGGTGSNYGISENFTKTFTSSTGQSLQFVFTTFKTQGSNDYLYIYDGPDATAPLIGQFSGSTSPNTIISSTSQLTFKFTSNSATQKKGWEATISCVNAPPTFNMINGSTTVTCDALFYDDGGNGGNYGSSLDIAHTFTSSTGTCLTFSWLYWTMTNLAGDTLMIYDGASTSSPLMGKYAKAGSANAPPALYSSGPSITFRFKSNGVTQNSGWGAAVSCGTCPTLPGAVEDYKLYTVGLQNSNCGGNMVNTCGGTLTDDGGISGNYMKNINLTYRTFCPNTAGTCLRANFFSYSVTSPDYLSIINSPTQNGTAILSTASGVCTNYSSCIGLLGGPFVSSDPSGCLGFKFYSNGTTESSGFVATLDCVPCAGGPTGLENYDCQNITALCSSLAIDDGSTGPGLISEGGAGCNLAENYSNWYSFTIQTGGYVEFTIDPTTNNDDYDFVIYGPNPTCGNLGNPIRCSYAANTGNTGMGSGALDTSETVYGNAWLKGMNVLAGQTYYLMVNQWAAGGDGFNLSWTLTSGATLDCTVLPVELTSFTCSNEGGNITLDWQTASEINNDHFIIEKSSDGENYSFMVEAKSNGGLLPAQYFALDNRPYAGVNYYRLSQVDNNGNTEILRTSSCTFEDDNSEVTLEVYDMSGKKLSTQKIKASEFNQTMYNLNLAKGIYLTAMIHLNGVADLSKYLKVN